jgi:hypothetical protein
MGGGYRGKRAGQNHDACQRRSARRARENGRKHRRAMAQTRTNKCSGRRLLTSLQHGMGLVPP